MQVVTLTFWVPASLKNEFKSIVSREGKTIKDVLSELVEDYVNQSKKRSHDG